ncbi:MAG: hypothetical protein Q8876_07135 [Bacillota bacterium]|nr:hypothetical protein [Bacillota bacterium]
MSTNLQDSEQNQITIDDTADKIKKLAKAVHILKQKNDQLESKVKICEAKVNGIQNALQSIPLLITAECAPVDEKETQSATNSAQHTLESMVSTNSQKTVASSEFAQVEPIKSVSELEHNEDFKTLDNLPYLKDDPEVYAEMKSKETLKRKIRKNSDKVHKAGKRIFSFFYFLVFALIIVTAALCVVSRDSGIEVFGIRLLNAPDNSMASSASDGFAKNSLVIIKKCDASDIKIGDIIAYSSESNINNYFIRRICYICYSNTNVQFNGYITKGDNIKNNNITIPGENIFGVKIFSIFGKKIFSVPQIGGLLKILNDYYIISIITAVVILILLTIIKLNISKPRET